MNKNLRLLIVDDSEDDAVLLIRHLKNAGYQADFRRVDSAEAMRSAMQEQTWDAIICDYVMPAFSAPEALKLLKESGLDLPFIVMSGIMGEETAVEMMKAGAHDYIRKDAASRLVPAIEREIADASVRAEKKWADAEILRSLREKEILLKEIHHRVKNNMQVISSLLELQSTYIKDKAALEVFRDGQNRIRSMALVHEMLYRSENMVHINFNDYIRNVSGHMFRFYGVSANRVRMRMDIDNAGFSLDTAVPFGLIVSELISNALKHAFPGAREGEMTVSLHERGENIEFIFQDNGIGFPENLDFKNTGSLGLHLVNSLVKQLSGGIFMDRADGTKFVITFKKSGQENIK
ncbi:MAG: response regulator [Nitrospirae bacterium]|nr:MAG: response regulator [Nitrospirota bacterium]